MCQSSPAVKLLTSESVNIVEGRGFESRRQLFFIFFFFFNIHTSDKLEIFFDHSILECSTHSVDPWGIHRFLGGINHENGVYSMGQRHECGFYRNRVSEQKKVGLYSIFILQIS